MNTSIEFEETALKDPVADLDRLVDLLIEHYGLNIDGNAEETHLPDGGLVPGTLPTDRCTASVNPASAPGPRAATSVCPGSRA